MSQPAVQRMSVAEFFAWQERQGERYELVDGFPLRMMAGAKNVHDDIAVNLLVFLGDRLRGSGCRPFTGDGSVEIDPGQIRRPDAGVDCGRRDPNGYTAAEPRMVAEVLSPSTRDLDSSEKVEEYKRVATLTDILLVEPNAPEVIQWSRGEDGTWRRDRIEGLDAEVTLAGLPIAIPLSALYEGVEFPARPRLLRD